MNIRFYNNPGTGLPHIYDHEVYEDEVEDILMKLNEFPPGWDEEQVQSIISHYDQQTEDEAVAEDEAAFQDPSNTLMAIPTELVPAVIELIDRHTVNARSQTKPNT